MLSTTHPCVYNSYGTENLAMSTWHSGSAGLEPGVTPGPSPTDKRRALQQQRQQAALNLFIIHAHTHIYYMYIYIYFFSVWIEAHLGTCQDIRVSKQDKEIQPFFP